MTKARQTKAAGAPERAHAVLSASGAHRWLVCTPSARLEDTLPDKTSKYSEEGTFAHAVAALELALWLELVSVSDSVKRFKEFGKSEWNTKENQDAISRYVWACKTKIAAARKQNADAFICIEQRLDYSHLVPEGFGTGDVVIIADKVLEVIDLKFGVGVKVSPVENEQAMLYGLGALASADFLFDIDTVRLTIHQPRIGDGEPQSWDISVKDLLTWAEEVLVPRAQIAWRGEGEFVPGDHCQFCRAADTCRARAEYGLSLAQHEFKEAPLLSDEEIADILPRVSPLKKWAEGIFSYALEKAKAGKKFRGYKLVRGTASRRYGDQDAVTTALAAAKVPAALYTESSLVNLTTLEKTLGKARFAELLPPPLVTKPPGALTLVPVTDKRPEVESSTEGFDDLTQEGDTPE